MFRVITEYDLPYQFTECTRRTSYGKSTDNFVIFIQKDP